MRTLPPERANDAWAQPGGAGYAISFANGSAECLVENSVVVRANKVMVSRSAGAGSVVGYNYVDEGYINTNGAWQEVGLNGSHMVGPHHMLFEGNYGFNYDSDKTHGSAIYHTVFRNHLSGVRHAFVNPHTGATIDDLLQPGNGPKRCAGLGYYSYWHSFAGNVLGRPGMDAARACGHWREHVRRHPGGLLQTSAHGEHHRVGVGAEDLEAVEVDVVLHHAQLDAVEVLHLRDRPLVVGHVAEAVLPVDEADQALVLQLVHHLLADRAVEHGARARDQALGVGAVLGVSGHVDVRDRQPEAVLHLLVHPHLRPRGGQELAVDLELEDAAVAVVAQLVLERPAEDAALARARHLHRGVDGVGVGEHEAERAGHLHGGDLRGRVDAVRHAAESRVQSILARGQQTGEKARELVSASQEALAGLQKRIDEKVRAAAEGVQHIPEVKRQLDDISQRIAQLEEKLDELSKK